VAPAAAEMLILAAQVYAAVGVAVALAFAVAGIGRVEPQARGAYAFRLVVLPGLVLLWPVVAARWLRLRAGTRG